MVELHTFVRCLSYNLVLLSLFIISVKADDIWLIPERTVFLNDFVGEDYLHIALPYNRLLRPTKLFVNPETLKQFPPIHIANEGGVPIELDAQGFIVTNTTYYEEQRLWLTLPNHVGQLQGKTLKLSLDEDAPELHIHFSMQQNTFIEAYDVELYDQQQVFLIPPFAANGCQFNIINPEKLPLVFKLNEIQSTSGYLNYCDELILSISSMGMEAGQTGEIKVLIQAGGLSYQHVIQLRSVPLFDYLTPSEQISFYKINDGAYRSEPFSLRINASKPWYAYLSSSSLLQSIGFAPNSLFYSQPVVGQPAVSLSGYRSGVSQVELEVVPESRLPVGEYKIPLEMAGQTQWLNLIVEPEIKLQTQLQDVISAITLEGVHLSTRQLLVIVDSNIQNQLVIRWNYSAEDGPDVYLYTVENSLHNLVESPLMINLPPGTRQIALPIFLSNSLGVRSGRYSGSFSIHASPL